MKLQVIVLVALQMLLCMAQEDAAALQKRAREAYLFTNNGAMERFRLNRRIKVDGEEPPILDEMSMSLSMSMSMGMGMKGKGGGMPGKGMKGDRRLSQVYGVRA